MIGLGLSIHAKSGNREELFQTVEHLRQEAAKEARCVECRVYEDLTQDGSFLWLQWWRSQLHLEEHLQSNQFRTLLGAIKVLGALESARVVELQDATSVMGALLTDRVDTSRVSAKTVG